MKYSMLGIFLISCLHSLAQETKDINDQAALKPVINWYNSPWAWVAGAAVFIFILVVLSNQKRKDKKNS